MSEPTISGAGAAAAVSVAVPAASVLPFINTDALIGAFAGGILFVLHARKFAFFKRFCYMIVSMIMGYFGGAELTARELVMNESMAAFIVSALLVTGAVWVIDSIRDGSFSTFFTRK